MEGAAPPAPAIPKEWERVSLDDIRDVKKKLKLMNGPKTTLDPAGREYVEKRPAPPVGIEEYVITADFDDYRSAYAGVVRTKDLSVYGDIEFFPTAPGGYEEPGVVRHILKKVEEKLGSVRLNRKRANEMAARNEEYARRLAATAARRSVEEPRAFSSNDDTDGPIYDDPWRHGA